MSICLCEWRLPVEEHIPLIAELQQKNQIFGSVGHTPKDSAVSGMRKFVQRQFKANNKWSLFLMVFFVSLGVK